MTLSRRDCQAVGANESEHPRRDFKFWMCIVAVMFASFLMSIELSGIGTAPPVIVADLQGKQFGWIAQVFGRRNVMLLQIFYFALGSALCGATTSLNFLIAGRSMGVSGIASLSQIIIADLVPLQERGTFNGLVALAFAFGTATAPIIAGSLAQHGQWRWFFYMNLPICGLTALISLMYLDLKVPRGTFKEKILSLDWMGNLIIVAATTAVVIELGEASRPLGIILFILYEVKVPKTPLVPIKLLTSRTSISGYIQAFFGNFYLLGTIFYLPTYFQACKGASLTRSGVDAFGLAFTTMPFGIIAGLSVAKSGMYRPQLWMAWLSLITGGALLSTLSVDSSAGHYIGFQVIVGLGLGILLTTGFFPVLAPMPPSLNANALAFFMFVRWFSQVWGVTFPGGTSISYSIIPLIRGLDEPLKRQVEDAFAESLRVFWLTLMAVACLGLISSLFMEGLPLHTAMDKDWGLNQKEQNSEARDGVRSSEVA
ncbi:hypothetical protein M0805_000009 [Coniferiporia weirii]|nr:hypothetical protein M0805_000009 [Coniferiporia weirii]